MVVVIQDDKAFQQAFHDIARFLEKVIEVYSKAKERRPEEKDVVLNLEAKKDNIGTV